MEPMGTFSSKLPGLWGGGGKCESHPEPVLELLSWLAFASNAQLNNPLITLSNVVIIDSHHDHLTPKP